MNPWYNNKVFALLCLLICISVVSAILLVPMLLGSNAELTRRSWFISMRVWPEEMLSFLAIISVLAIRFVLSLKFCAAPKSDENEASFFAEGTVKTRTTLVLLAIVLVLAGIHPSLVYFYEIGNRFSERNFEIETKGLQTELERSVVLDSILSVALVLFFLFAAMRYPFKKVDS